MSDLLHAPWMLHTALEDLTAASHGPNSLGELHKTVRLAQIIQFMPSGSQATHLLAHMSDKFHYLVGFFTDASLGKFIAAHPQWKVTDIQGALVKLVAYRFVKLPAAGGTGNSVVLVVEEFEHVGSDGSAAFGDPRYIMANPAVKAALDRPPPSSPNKHLSVAAEQRPFYSTLGPTDLLFLESTCTQTMKHSQAAFPVVITDADWRIPAEQARRLAQIDFPRLEPAFTLLSESEIELESEEEDRARSSSMSSSFRAVLSPAKSSMSSSIHEAPSPAKRIKVDSAGETSGFSQSSGASPVRFRIIESSQPASMAPLTQAPITQPMTQLSPKARVQEPSPKPAAKKAADQPLLHDFPDYAEW